MISFYAMPGNEHMAGVLAHLLGGRVAPLVVHRFPDHESLVRVESPLGESDAVIVCTMDDPDRKLAPLLFAAATLEDLGARRVGLVAPYLAYMRQDRRFAPGESISARYFAAILSSHFDWIVTVDPHLHRHRSLDEIFTIPTMVAQAAPAIANWIAAAVEKPLIVGPDEESRQWAEDVAARVGAPCVVLAKQRLGDRDVRVSAPDISRWHERMPVLIDDIISTGATLAANITCLRGSGLVPPICIGIHGLFAEHASVCLEEAGAGYIVTTNTVPGALAGIDISEAIAACIRTIGTQEHVPGPRSCPEAD
jgi:ribose-phosphate pyrophosphokinase